MSGTGGQPARSGLVVVDKPAGMTSHDVVARVRWLAGTRKVGHAGTLDPMATGVLLVGVNRATRLLGHLMLTEKAYDGVVRLGESTTTDDAEGESLGSTPSGHLTEAEIRTAAARFVGDIEQVPSAVSAIKIDGRRAYKRVRAGESVDLPARPVTVHDLSVGAVRRDGDFADVEISVRCSSGTYIRAIARDLGFLLGVGGHLRMLRRTAVGPFDLADARSLDQLAEELVVLPMGEVAQRCFPTWTADEDQAREIGYGRKLTVDLGAAGPVAVLDERRELLALYEQAGPVAAPVAVFTG